VATPIVTKNKREVIHSHLKAQLLTTPTYVAFYFIFLKEKKKKIKPAEI